MGKKILRASYSGILKLILFSIFLMVISFFIGRVQAQTSQIVHDTQTEFSTGPFNQTILEGTETAPEINLNSYSVFSWSFVDDNISGWTPMTKDSAIAEVNPPGQMHLRAQRSTQNESYALFTRSLTVPSKFVVEYRIYFDNLRPSGVSVPGDLIGNQPTGACARLDLWNPSGALRMDIFTNMMVSFWTRNAGIKDYPTVSYFDVTTEVSRWYTLRLEGDFTDPQLPVQVYRDNVWIGKLKGITTETGNSIRPMVYSREIGQVAEVHIDSVKLGTATKQYYATGTYTSPVLDLGATSFGSLSWTDKATGYPYPWGEWTKYEGNPVVEESPNGNLVENILTDISDPLQQPILYPHPDTKVDYYWLVNATCCGGDIRISYSPDLLEWTPYEHNPILSPRPGEGYLFSPNIFRKDGLYYLVHDVSIDGKQRIAYATALSPLGPWTGGWTTGQRILDIGAEGTWEYGRVSEPFVFRDGDTYYLFYMGDIPSSGNGEQIGLATTTADLFPLGPEPGGLWTKHGLILPHNPDPTAWDRGLTADPSVIKVGATFYMLYTGSWANVNWQLGIAWASSPFGPWNRPSSPNVLRGPPGSWDSNQLVRGAIHFHDGKYYMPYTGNYGKYRGGMATADPYVPENLIAFETRTSSNGTDWGSWTPVLNGADISSAPARYLQYQATLNLGLGGSSPGLTSVTINYDTNTAPVANNQSLSTKEDTAVAITLIASDANGNVLSYDIVTPPSSGSLSGDAPAVTYTPNPNFNGVDSFTFTANDGTVDSNVATVTITVNAVNDVPVAFPDGYSTNEDTQLVVSAPGVLGNDSDVDANPLTAILVAGPSHGSLALDAYGSFTYTPFLNYHGPDSFTYKANDGIADSNVATVSLTVNPVNDAPVANDQNVTTAEDIAAGIILTGSDLDGDSLTYGIVTPPAHGTLSGTAPNLTYTPASNYHGPDSFTYKANDGSADSNVATVSLTITEVNDAPKVSVSTATQTVQYSDGIAPITITATDVDSISLTATVTDPVTGLPSNLTLKPSDPLCTTNPSNGETTCTWTIEGIAGVPEGDYPVTITVTDGDGGSVDAEITITVEPEDAAVAFAPGNPIAVRATVPTSNGNASDSFSLIVYVTEAEDDLLGDLEEAGDISKALVSMTLQPVGPGSPVSGDCESVLDGAGYTSSLTTTCDFDSVPVNIYTVQVTVNGTVGGSYYEGSGEDVLVVYDPSLGFATGGGWFYWPNTEDPDTGYLGDRTNFGFTMKYNKKGTNVQGSLLLIRHLENGLIYRVKSNALDGLALGNSPGVGWASFYGKSTYLDPDWTEPAGNYAFIVYVEDNNEPGNGVDKFWIQVKDQDRKLVSDMSMLPEATAQAVLIQGGNIVVPHSR
jgi:VCBS repeat-containing protein